MYLCDKFLLIALNYRDYCLSNEFPSTFVNTERVKIYLYVHLKCMEFHVK